MSVCVPVQPDPGLLHDVLGLRGVVQHPGSEALQPWALGLEGTGVLHSALPSTLAPSPD